MDLDEFGLAQASVGFECALRARDGEAVDRSDKVAVLHAECSEDGFAPKAEYTDADDPAVLRLWTQFGLPQQAVLLEESVHGIALDDEVGGIQPEHSRRDEMAREPRL